jgi:sulfur transfer complex TusBCD TusB component (DsrH family)
MRRALSAAMRGAGVVVPADDAVPLTPEQQRRAAETLRWLGERGESVLALARDLVARGLGEYEPMVSP